ncbi:response regulator transcription factor [Amylibacter sp. SFDW26]|uniref:response regulator transcription factor n=1 Tax=Amylibacter sp. SFDW26 TaxID=2652722 RepID=UPI001261D78E|nr:response regulator transcription factor [Amylibacter sp. SFDW26]KAB7613611.1 response regulator transcription factor [Amylibacter sp. SFDW26]
MGMSSLVIADSHEIVREGIAFRLKESCDVNIVAEAIDGYSAIKYCRQLQPDILIMDFHLLRPSGMETLTKIRKAQPEIKIIVLSSDPSTANAFFILSQGAVGFMPKQARGSDFVNAFVAAQSGYAYLPVELMEEFVKLRRNLTRTGNVFGLSPREIEILEATLSGLSTKDVAKNLLISVRTVETHRNSIYKKTSCRNYKELATIVGVN